MLSPLASQNVLYGLSRLSPLALLALDAASTTSSAAAIGFDSASSIVSVSALGQVLGAGSVLERSLSALQATPAVVTPSAVVSSAENFVTAFNEVQQSISTLQPLLTSLPEDAAVTQFSATLNADTATATNNGAANLASLQQIGITARTVATPNVVGTTATLSIDTRTLDAAASVNPAATLSTLQQATQPLLQQVATFEAQATSSAGLPADIGAQTPLLPIALLQNVSADTALNGVQLNTLDLAAAGLDANTVQATPAVLASALSTTLAQPLASTTTPVTAPSIVVARSATVTTTSPEQSGSNTEAVSSAPVAVDTTTAVVTPSTVTATPAVVATSAATTDQTASTASIALQNLLADPSLRAISNSTYNPFSAAFISTLLNNPLGAAQIAGTSLRPADIPAPVAPVPRVRAVTAIAKSA